MFSYPVSAAIAYITGLLLSPYIYSTSPKLFAIMLTAFILVPVFLVFAANKAYKMKLWILAIVPACFISGVYITGYRTNTDIKPLKPFEGTEITVIGTVCSEIKEYESGCSFIIKSDTVISNGKKYKIIRKIKASSDTVPVPGKCISAKGKLSPIKEKLNSTSFDSKNYYAQNGIFHSVYAKEISETDNPSNLNFAEKINLMTNMYISDFTEKCFSDEDAALMKGILLNNKSEITDETYAAMQQSGTNRYIYCTYIHICLILFLISHLIKKKSAKNTVITVLLLLYLILNTGKPSAWKICLFIPITYIFYARKGVKSIKPAVAFTVLITAVLSPYTVKSDGFILSVSATILISAFSKPLYNFMIRIFRHRKMSASVSVFFIFTVLMSPLAKLLGYNLTLYSYIAGLILIPAINTVYILSPLAILSYILTGSYADTVIHYILKFITGTSYFISGLPGSTLVTIPFGKWFTLAFYFLIYSIYSHISKRRFSHISVCASLIFATIVSGVMYSRRNLAEVSFVSVGNADCCVIKLPTGENIMIDGGGSPEYTDYNIGDSEVIPYLSANGISKLDCIILSHYDKDHAQGIVSAIRNLKVDNIIMPDYIDSGIYKETIKKEAKLRNIDITYIRETQRHKLAENLYAKFIYTEGQQQADNSNDASLVTHLTYGNVKMLFTGDITRPVEAGLSDINCDILKIPHHGSKTSTSEYLLSKTTPIYSVFCVGENNPYGHPVPMVLNRCRKYGSEIIRTDECGDVHFYINTNKIHSVSSFRKGSLTKK